METAIERFREDCLSDLAFFAENPAAPLHIAPEDGPISPVKLRRAQVRLANVLNVQWYSRGCVRIIVCKARRIGSTTFFCMDAYRQASLRPNMNVVIGAQLDEMAERIHERNHVFHANYPPALRPERQGKSRSFKEPMEFRRTPTDADMATWESGGARPDMGLNSSVSIFTERTPLARTGATVQYLLLSEFAKYRNQSTIIKEMFPTVRRGTGAIVIDTTAEGRGDSYSRLWEEAVAGRSEFEPVFIGWLDDEQQCHQKPTAENTRLFYEWLACAQMQDGPGVDLYSKKLCLEEDEVDLLRTHILPRWQKMPEEDRERFHPMGWIEWRRWAIRDRCDGKVQIFRNQYPTHWREAFLSTSITIFDMGQLASQSDRVKDQPPPLRGNMVRRDGGDVMEVDPQVMMAQTDFRKFSVTPGMYSFKEESFGPVRIFKPPEAGEEYLVSSDYAEGVSDNCDYNVIHIYKRGEVMEQVAWFREKCYPEECASEAIALGAFYNMAWQVPEVNSCGAAALAMFRTCYPLDRIFRRRPSEKGSTKPVDLLGWRMTGRSKAEAISSGTTFWKQGRCILNSKNALRELEVYVKKSSRMLPEAMAGTDPVTGEPYHDDEVTCVILAIFGNRQLPWKGAIEAARDDNTECRHLNVADCVCVDCGMEFKELRETMLTFDSLRQMVGSNANATGGRAGTAMLDYWLP
jgi:hypothetical protein